MVDKCCDSDVKCYPKVHDGYLAFEVSTKCYSIMVTSCQKGGVKVLCIKRDDEGERFEELENAAKPETVVDLLFGKCVPSR